MARRTDRQPSHRAAARKRRRQAGSHGTPAIRRALDPRAWHALLRGSTALTAAGLVAGGIAGYAGYAMAAPSGGTVVEGAAEIVETAPGVIEIRQQSDKVIIEWQNFDIGAGESVSFIQPDALAAALNRVLSGQASAILGNLTANGQIIITNPAGIVFGPQARVDVASIIASTLGITNANFLSGRMIFDQAGDPRATVTNQGQITAAEGGLAALVAPGVVNSGTIVARLGTVALAAGNAVTLDFYGDGLVQIAVHAPVREVPLGVDGQPMTSLIEQQGGIYADGGTVVLTAEAAEGVLDRVINVAGITQAQSVEAREGQIAFVGGTNGEVQVGGTVDASGTEAGEHGGTVHVLGQQVALADGAAIDVSGDAGGGTVLVGGDYQGGAHQRTSGLGYLEPSAGDDAGLAILLDEILQSQGYIPQSDVTYIAGGATIDASGVSDGSGGKIVAWSNGTTTFAGTAYARAGIDGGSGGFIEVSGLDGLSYRGNVDTRAPNGSTGWLLLDPGQLDVTTAASAGGDPEKLNDADLNAALTGSNVALRADTKVVVEAGTNVVTGAQTLFFDTQTVDLYANITGNVAGGSGFGAGTVFGGSAAPLSDPTSVNVLSTAASIQDAINIVGAGGTVTVGDGAYVENIVISKTLSLLSENGRALTSITGVSGVGALGTVRLTGNTSGVEIGGIGQGFTITGIDNGAPGIENAAIYLQGPHQAVSIIGNEIVAAGDAGLSSEYGNPITGIVIDSNIFSGQTFLGAQPAGIGFGSQFTLANVPRQLVVLGGSGGVANSGVTFTNNIVSGTTGGISSTDGVTPQGNTLVTLDFTDFGVSTSTISGNQFTGDAAGVGYALRVRQQGVVAGNTPTITGNTFGADAQHFFTNYAGITGAGMLGSNSFVGNTVTLGGSGSVLTTLQAAINLAAAGDTLTASAGTFAENIVIWKSLTLEGANAGLAGDDSGRGAETIITPGASGLDTVVGVIADNVTIDGVTIDGDNAGLTTAAIADHTNGGDPDAYYGVANTDNLGNYIAIDGLTLQNSVVTNLTDATGAGEGWGVVLWTGAATPMSGNLITSSLFDYAGTRSIVLLWNGYASVTDNVIQHTPIGIYAENMSQAQPGTPWSWTGNEVHASVAGIWHNLQYSTATPLTIAGNDVFAEVEANAAYAARRWAGIWITSIQSAVDVTVQDNDIDGSLLSAGTRLTAGYEVWNLPTTADIALEGGTVEGVDYGVWAQNWSPSFSAGGATQVAVTGMTIETVADGVGVFVEDHASGTAAIGVEIRNTPSLIDGAGGTAVGLLADGALATLSLTGANPVDFVGFTGAGQNYIALRNGAMAGQDIDATGATFEGLLGSAFSAAQGVDAENRIEHHLDSPVVGFVRLDAGRIWVGQSDAATGNHVTQDGAIGRAVAKSAAGDTVHVGAGTFEESIAINKALTVAGAGQGQTIIAPNSPGFDITGTGTDIVLSGFTVQDSTDYGVRINASADYDSITIDDAEFIHNGLNGVALFGNAATGSLVDALVITNSSFTENGAAMDSPSATSLGMGDILAFFFNGDLTIQNVDIHGYATGGANYAIQVRGANTPAAFGTMLFDTVSIDGSYRRPHNSFGTFSHGGPGAAIALFTSTDVSGVSFNDVTLALSEGHGLQVDGLSTTLDIGNTEFDVATNGWDTATPLGDVIPSDSIAIPSQLIFVGTSSLNPVKTNVDATDAVFPVAFDNFDIEDAVAHALDSSALGLVTWLANNVYVTQLSGSIQRGIDAASSGWTVNVNDGTYAETPEIDKSLTVQSANGRDFTTIELQAGPTYLGALTITGNGIDVTIDGFTIVGRDGTATDLAASNVYLGSGLGDIVIQNNRFQVGEIGSSSNGDDGFGILTTYDDTGLNDVESLTVTGNLFEPLTTTGRRAFYINPGVQDFVFSGNDITGGFTSTAITQAKNGLIEGNTITGTGASATVGAWGYPDPDVHGQTIFRANTISGTAAGIRVFETNNVTIENNFFDSVGIGVSVLDLGNLTGLDGSTVKIFNNSFEGVTGDLVENTYASAVDASGNWFDSDDESVIAGSMSGLVDFTPYLVSDADTSVAAGFQGDFSVLHVTALGAQTDPGVGTNFGAAAASGLVENRVHEGVDMVTASTVLVGPGLFNESGQILIDIDTAVIGSGKGTNPVTDTIIQANFDTGSSGNARGWWLVDSGIDFEISDLTLSGTGFKIWQAIRHLGTGEIDSVRFQDIVFEPSGGAYAGTAVAAFGGVGPVDVTNSDFVNIGRIGVQYFGAGTTGTFSGNTYTGKGAGNWLDYAVEVGAGAVADITGNVISDNLGVALSDGSTSAGILVSTFFGPGSRANIGGNTLSDNTTAIFVGFNTTDSSTIELLSGNSISGGTTGIRFTGNGQTLVGDTFSDTVFSGQSGNYITLSNDALSDPLTVRTLDATGATFDGVLAGTATAPQLLAIEAKVLHYLDDADKDLILLNAGSLVVTPGNSIQLAVNAAGALVGPQTVTVAAGTYGGSVEIWVDDITLQGAGVGATFIDTTAVDAFANNGDRNNGFWVGAIDAGGSDPSGSQDVSGVTIDGFTFTALGVGTGTENGLVVDPGGNTVSDLTIDHVAATGNAGNGLLFTDSTGISGGAQAGRVENVIVRNSSFDGNGRGIFVGSLLREAEGLSFTDIGLTGNVNEAFLLVGGNSLSFASVDEVGLRDNITLERVSATDNGVSPTVGGGRPGAIGFLDFEGKATLTDVTITGNDSGAGTGQNYGLQFRGLKTLDTTVSVNDAATVTDIQLTRVEVAGDDYDRINLQVQEMRDAGDFSFTDVELNAAYAGPAAPPGTLPDVALWAQNNGGVLDIGNTLFAAGHTLYAVNFTDAQVDATGATFGAVTPAGLDPLNVIADRNALFAIEDKILHVIDSEILDLGFTRVRAGEVFVTAGSFVPFITLTPDVGRGVRAAAAGDTLFVGAGTFDAAGQPGGPTPNQVAVAQDLTVIGMGMGTTVINPIGSTGAGSLNPLGAWFVADVGVAFNLSDVTLDGSGFNIWHGIRHLGTGAIDSVEFTEIKYPGYGGVAISIRDGADVDVTDSTFSQIGRVGMHYFGAGTTGTASGNTYTGKGAVDGLDYAVEVGAGAVVDILNNQISDNLGVALSDGSTSAGILVTTYFGPGSRANIGDNTLTDNTVGVAVGYDTADSSTIQILAGNQITGGEVGIFFTGDHQTLVGNTFANTIFSGQSGDYITLDNDALSNPATITVLDATGVTFDGVLATAATPAQLVAIENKLLHYLDDPEKDLINLDGIVVGPGGSIQQAVNAAGIANSSMVIVQAGTYGGSVEVWVDGLTLLGLNNPVINTNAVDPFANNGNEKNGFYVGDIRFLGDGSLGAWWSDSADNWFAVDGVTISGFTFQGGDHRSGVVLEGQKGLVSNTTIADSVFNGMDYGVLSDSGRVTGTLIMTSQFFGQDRSAIRIDGRKDGTIEIRQVTIDDTDGDAIDIKQVDEATITDTSVDDSDGDGISVEKADKLTIVDTDVTDSDDDGIRVKDVKDVTIQDTDVADSKDNGIEVENADELAITDSTVTDSDDNGIKIKHVDEASISGVDVSQSKHDGITVEKGDELTITDTTVADSKDDGIRVKDVDEVVIAGSAVDDSDDHGIDVQKGDELTISDSTVTDSKKDGIHVEHVDEVKIEDSDVTDSGDNGITVKNADEVKVLDNTVTGNDDTGIYVRDFDTAWILGNTSSYNGKHGIDVEKGKKAYIKFNTTKHNHNDGIEVDDVRWLWLDSNLSLFNGGQNYDID